MINQLHVEHFRSIPGLSLSMPQRAIIVGPNGSGKSNIIDSIKFLKDALLMGLDRAVSDRHGIDTIRQWSISRPYNLSIGADITVGENRGSYKITLASKGGLYSIIREEGSWTRIVPTFDRRPDKEQLDLPSLNSRTSTQKHETTSFLRDKDSKITLQIHYGQNMRSESHLSTDLTDELFLRSPTLSRAIEPADRDDLFAMARSLRSLDQFRNVLTSFEAYSIFPNTLRFPQNITNDERLYGDGSNFSSVFRSLPKTARGREARTEIIESLRGTFPALRDITIRLIGGFLVPIFRVEETDGKKHEFNVSQISDGTLRVLGLLTALYHPNRPSTIALEEPEQTIHPGVLSVISDAIKDVGTAAQVLITSHSPHLLDYFEPENIIAVHREADGTYAGPISHLQLDAVKENLFSLGEIMSMEGLASA